MKGIASKLLAVQRKVGGYVPKNGRMVGGGGNYSFVQDADVAAIVSAAMNECGLVSFPKVEILSVENKVRKSGSEFARATVRLTTTFIDPDSGESFASEMIGVGDDQGDKHISKAVTAASKYTFLKLLCLSDQADDPDQYSSADGERTQSAPATLPRKELAKAVVVSGDTESPDRPLADTVKRAVASAKEKATIEQQCAEYSELATKAGAKPDDLIKPAGLRLLFGLGVAPKDLVGISREDAKKMAQRMSQNSKTK